MNVYNSHNGEYSVIEKEGMKVFRFNLREQVRTVYRYYGHINHWDKDMGLRVQDEIITYLLFLVKDCFNTGNTHWDMPNRYLLEAINEKRMIYNLEPLDSLDIDMLTSMLYVSLETLFQPYKEDLFNARYHMSNDGNFDLICEEVNYEIQRNDFQ